MAKRDYYEVLGVDKTADADAIKQGYRRMARKYHPDRTEDPDGEAKFKEVGEAYEVLKDPDKRAKYDQWGHAWEMGGRAPPPPPGGGFYGNGQSTGDASMDEILRRMREMGMNIDEADLNINMGGQQQENVQKVGVDVHTMINGGKTVIRYVVPQQRGMAFSFQNSMAEITLKPNTPVGTRMRSSNVPNTTFVLIPQSTTRCRVEGLDLVVPFQVNALAAAVGNKCKVAHPNGKSYDVAIPPGARNGQGLRLPGLGLTHVNGAKGNLIAVIDYVVPVLKDDAREALKKLIEEA